MNTKNKVFPMVLTVIILVIVIYLFANFKQSSVSCSKTDVGDLDIKIIENLDASLDGNKISTMKLKKTIILPDKYLDDDKYLDYIKDTIEKSYEYLGKGKVKFSKMTDRVIAYIDVKGDETLILNNISFVDDNGLKMVINPNTKSSDVVTLRIKDNYNEGQLMSHLKNNGYICQ